ncbi:BLUF domain-containing protein [Cereibacter azotoformans]|uniref:BLUF domain protein n=1 Tax=Cereibacter sphaeroides (strain ATCC 17025 / ATH 2.4.3) TaxID=349102 RepID=A4WX15_CERS5|nr:BLUF domain-containing protein [Cereibacter azotoformans]ULB10796.1 BLUF domain-containing protein [Cereibacter azotoformans]
MVKEREAKVAMAGSDLISCCYRSLAAPSLTMGDLIDIVEASRRRNAELQITGALFYADGRFLQWLEGPADAVNGLLDGILRDGRHSGFELLAKEPATERRFSGWHMQLSCPESDLRSLGITDGRQIVAVGRSLLPEGTDSLSFDRIATVGHFLSDVCAARSLASEMDEGTATIYPLHDGPARRSARAEAVARLCDLLLADPLGRIAEIESLLRAHAPTAADFARLYETCAERMLRDLAEDRTTRLRLTLACSALQMVLRRIHHLPDPQNSVGAVTVTAVPGQTPILEAALAGEMLRAAGWSTSILHPESAEDLIGRLRATRTATLVVAPSLLEGTDHDRETLRLIAALRARRDLPEQRILIGGGLAQLAPSMLKEAGADAGFRHLSQLTASVAGVACPHNAECCSMRACRMPASQFCGKRINPDFLLANVMPSVMTRLSARQERRRTA